MISQLNPLILLHIDQKPNLYVPTFVSMGDFKNVQGSWLDTEWGGMGGNSCLKFIENVQLVITVLIVKLFFGLHSSLHEMCQNSC